MSNPRFCRRGSVLKWEPLEVPPKESALTVEYGVWEPLEVPPESALTVEHGVLEPAWMPESDWVERPEDELVSLQRDEDQQVEASSAQVDKKREKETLP